jgi:hypothetical protein
MKTKIKFLAVGLALLSLASCKTTEVHGANDYLAGAFQNLYYSEHHDFASSLGAKRSSYTLTSDQFCDALYGETGSITTQEKVSLTRQGILTKYPDLMTYQGKTLSEHDAYSLNDNGEADSYVGKDFGRTKCLATQDASFKNTGIISKLYDGQTLCHSTVFKAMFALENDGIQVKMPKTVASSDYFIAVVRGGGNTSEYRYAKLDITFTFYFAQEGRFDYTTVTTKDTYVYCDEGEHANYVGFKFADAGINDVSSIVGWGISYANVVDLAHPEAKFVPSGEDDTYFGLMLYEIMFPDAKFA